MTRLNAQQKERFYALLKELMDLTGWEMGLEKQADDAQVQGVMLGNKAFLDKIEYSCKVAVEQQEKARRK
jgi:hypothetical protein